jgi:hypothetical protein
LAGLSVLQRIRSKVYSDTLDAITGAAEMSHYISAKQFGSFSQKGDKIKTWRRAKDASQKQRWRKSTKKTVISRRTAAKLARP